MPVRSGIKITCVVQTVFVLALEGRTESGKHSLNIPAQFRRSPVEAKAASIFLEAVLDF